MGSCSFGRPIALLALELPEFSPNSDEALGRREPKKKMNK
jgi:hypothetical protein